MRRSGQFIAALIAMVASFTQSNAAVAGPLADRIGHTDATKYRRLAGVHAGAGTMAFEQLLGSDALSTNLIFVHRGVIAPHSGIGEHFHNQCEEMFVILDGEAQFTIDGRTATIAGPAGAPDTMGHAHAIYNATDKPLQWLNINVGVTKRYDNFDLGDTREGAPLDRVAQFVTMRLDRSLLKPVVAMDGGQGTVMYRRLLEPSIFATNWSFVDHLLMPPGTSSGSVSTPGMSEVYYVVAGTGEITVARERASIGVGDAVPVDVAQAHSLRATGTAPLELMVIGVASDPAAKQAYAAATAPPRPK